MIIAKCPLRVSLAGGSTDLESFIQTHGRGAVVSFPTNLYTYITLHDDLLGYNVYSKKYIINYSKREEVENVEQIKNDIARVALKHFNEGPLTCGFTTDIFSIGSGLASSSSYMISFIKALLIQNGQSLSNFEICKLSTELERKFNPLTGYQDTYGCGIGGLKRMDFIRDRDPRITYLSKQIFDGFDMFLIYTGVGRRSTALLREIENTDRTYLLELAQSLHEAIDDNDKFKFLEIISEGWECKRKTSKKIIENPNIVELDASIEKNDKILAHRLCGAGNGGYFLVFMNRERTNYLNLKEQYKHVLPISISDGGVTGCKI